jgi:hypothetical protein
MQKNALETGSSLHWDPVEETWGGLILPGTFTDRWRALETERLFLWELCEGNLEGCLIYWESWRSWFGKQTALSIGDSLGNLRGGVFVYDRIWQTVKESSEKGNLSMGPLWRTWREGSFPGNSESCKNTSRKALEMEHISPYKGSVRWTWREVSYTEDSKRPVIEGTGNGAFHL